MLRVHRYVTPLPPPLPPREHAMTKPKSLETLTYICYLFILYSPEDELELGPRALTRVSHLL